MALNRYSCTDSVVIVVVVVVIVVVVIVVVVIVIVLVELILVSTGMSVAIISNQHGTQDYEQLTPYR